MSKLTQVVAAHPLQKKKPYNALRFTRVDGHGTPLYRLKWDEREMGAYEALKVAFEKLGAHCFHCKKWIEAQPMPAACTRDHLLPKKNGGRDFLHNLVFACAECNRNKGSKDIVDFNVERGSEYLKALDAHLVRCIAELGN
jgi:5-methylcytosine-specific restriction endonuclease McrA